MIRSSLLTSLGFGLTFSATLLVAAAGLAPDTLVPGDVGDPAIDGVTTNRADAIEIVAAGMGIGFKADQFHFAAASEVGDFDVRVRVSVLKPTDLWAKAGLMLRADRTAGAPFAGVFVTPSGVGCLFQSRDTDSANAANQGFFPANQPFAWLRIRRVGDELTGYAGYDGRRWTELGSRSVAWGTNALLGLAVTSHSTKATTAEFHELGAVTDGVEEEVPVPIEPLGPSSRRSSLVITEIMYHPADRADGKNLEFVELYNSQPYFEDISGWKLTGDIEFTFPAGTVMAGGSFLVVAAAPADIRSVHGVEALGPVAGKLDNAGGSLRLLGAHDAVFLRVDFKDEAPWPELSDGTGHSLVLVRPSYGEGDPRAWAASRVKGGSPGTPEAVDFTAAAGVRINECQVQDGAGGGFVELFNGDANEADLGGLRLGSSPDSLPFRVPADTKLAPGGFMHFTWAQVGFNPKPTGDALYLESADGTRFLDAVKFVPQAPGTTAGRWPNGGQMVCLLPQPTPGAANVRPRSDVVINEIHHSPISGDTDEEFIELFNAGDASVDLSFWEFTSGVNFTFPQGTSIPAGGYLVLAHNTARLLALHPNLASRQLMGNFSGKLSGRTDHLVLSRPVTVRTGSGKNETVLAAVTEAAYAGSGRWSRWSDAGGSTLELIDTRANTSWSSSWADSDESGRGEWTTVEFSGVLDNGPAGGRGGGGPGGGGRSITPDSLHILLLGEGECLIDNVEVLGPGNTNRIANGTFEEGIAGWTFSGNHVRSGLETTAGDRSGQSLHLRASGNGDTGANKIYVKLTQPLATNATATLRARVKWLHGWPEILLRVHGNYLEAYGRLATPAGSGTPGERNSRATANAGPAFGEVTHFPAVPAADKPVLVTAQIDDPDGVGSVTLRYRVDPDSTLANLPMRDDGTAGDRVAGDGVYSTLIPAPGAARLLAFTIEARDRAASGASTVFPPSVPSGECLVRFGDGVSSGAFGTYRLWVSQANSAAWKNRPVLSNEPVESTFVYGSSRVVYNAGARFAGSPYHQQFPDGPASSAHFVVELPKNDRVMGAAAFNKLHAPGNAAFDDSTLQREQVVYWLARQSGLPWLHRRYFHFYVNGTRKQTLMEDTQVGSDDLVEEFWPQHTDGQLYKLQPWFEFPDAVSQTLQMSSSTFVSLSRYTTTGNELKLARYRWNWLVRGAEATANDYTNVLQFIDVVTGRASPTYETEVECLADVDEWLTAFAINHSVGNWDSVGYRNAQNTYSYKPRGGLWELVIWDANIALGGGGSDGPANLPLFTTSDPTISRWLSQGGFKRRFLTAYHELLNGPFQLGRIAPMLDAKYAAFQEHGVKATSPDPIKTWITSARSYILSQIGNASAAFAVTNVTGADSLTLSGTAPLNMVSLEINGTTVPVTWTSTKTWTASFAPAASVTRLTVSAVDRGGQLIAGTAQEFTLSAPAALKLRAEGAELVFEYPVARSGRFRLEWSTSLVAPEWHTSIEQDATSEILEFRLPLPTTRATFYRLVEL